MKMRMDRPTGAKSKSLSGGNTKQNVCCSEAGGGYSSNVSVNGYGNVKVGQSRKMG